MLFFSEHADTLLHNWFEGATWYIDKPSENAKFYRFVAALMHDLGQPDIREVRCALQEAGSYWASDFAARNGEHRIAALCERLQVLYDFFGAVSGAASLPAKPASPQPQPLPPTTSGLPMLRQEVPAAFIAPTQAFKTPEQALSTSVQQDKPKPSASRKAQSKKQAQVKAGQNEIEREEDLPSQARWEQFCHEVIRLHVLLLERREQPPSVRIPSSQTEAIAAEMRRWTDEVLQAEEITDAEKRNLIGTIIDKVMPDIEGSTVTIKWLK